MVIPLLTGSLFKLNIKAMTIKEAGKETKLMTLCGLS